VHSMQEDAARAASAVLQPAVQEQEHQDTGTLATAIPGSQNTMLMAATGVTVAVTLRPMAAMRAPAMTPILALQLYSIAGAR
jgi:hypothetical protein